MFSGNIYYRGDNTAAEDVLHEATQLANLASVKKAALGVPNFREQITLSSGATLDVVLGEHTSFITIVGEGAESKPELVSVLEEEEEYANLFSFRPMPNYPQAVISLDKNAPDGVSLRWGDNIKAGIFYTQPSVGGFIPTLSTNPPVTKYIEGVDAAHIAGSKFAYIGGFKLIESVFDRIIGVGVFNKQYYIFIVNEALYTGLITIYAHAYVQMDLKQADTTAPFLDWADCVKIHTTGAVDLSYGFCTFNKSGTKAILPVLGEVIEPNPPSTLQGKRRKRIYEYTFTANITGPPSVTEVLDETVSWDVYTKDFSETAPTFGDAGPQPSVLRMTYSDYFGWLADDAVKVRDQTFPNAGGDFYGVSAAIMGSNGVIEVLKTNSERKSLKNGFPEGIIGSTRQSTAWGWYPTGNVEYSAANCAKRIDAWAGQPNVAQSVPLITELDNITYTDKQKNEFSWGDMVETGNSVAGVANSLVWVETNPSGVDYRKVARYSPSYSCVVSPNPTPPPTNIFTPTPDPTGIGPLSAANEAAGACQEEYLYSTPMCFSLRDKICLIVNEEFYKKPGTYAFIPGPQYDDPSYLYYAGWEAPDYTKGTSVWFTLSTPFGLVDIPGVDGNKTFSGQPVDITEQYLPTSLNYVPRHDNTSRTQSTPEQSVIPLTHEFYDTYGAEFSPGDVLPVPVQAEPRVLSSSQLPNVRLATNKNWALYSINDMTILSNPTPVSWRTCLNLLDIEQNVNVDIIEKYNQLLASDLRTAHLAPLLYTTAAGGYTETYMTEYGVIDSIPEPVLYDVY